jgi:hypothetical protein
LRAACASGEKDPWEKLAWGLEFKKYESVEEFKTLPGACSS